MDSTPKQPSACEWIAASHLWLVLDRKAALPLTLPEVTKQAIAGGVDVVLCRIKDEPVSRFKDLAKEIRHICLEHGVPFVMSHNPELAAELQAEAVQLGVGDPAIADVREMIGHDIRIGYSTHSVAEAKQRFEEGADYVFLGPIFATPEKLKYGAPLGIDTVAIAANLPGPVVFIGGISCGNVQELLDHTARRIAAIGALQRTTDVQASTRKLRAQLCADLTG